MRKLFLLGLTAFVIIGFAALGISWNQRASVAKEAIESFLASLNTDNSKVTYEAINVSGFPMNMNISIINPSFTGQIDKLINTKDFRNALEIKKFPEWNESVLLNGNINIGINIFSDKFTLSQTGSFKSDGKIAGKKITLESEYAGSNICTLQLKNTGSMFSNLWDSDFLFSKDDKPLENFRSLDCKLSAGKTINSETKETIITFANSFISIGHTPKDKISDMFFRMKLSNIEVTKAYDEILSIYQKSFLPDQEVASISIYGKQNIEIDLSYSGSKDLRNPKAMELPLEIKVNKFLLSNAVYDSNISAKIINIVKGEKRNSSIYYRSESTVTKLAQEIMKEQLIAIKNSMLSSDLLNNSELARNLSGMSSEELNKLIYSVIPDFAGLGKMVMEIDADYSGSKNLSDGQIKLKSFELSTTPYGITANANINRNKANMLPSGNLSLSCVNCFDMIDSIVAYLDKVRKAALILTPSKVSGFVLTPEAVQAVKSFLLTIASEKNGTLKFDLVNNEGGAITINGQNVMKIFAIFTQTVVPKLK